MNAPTSATRAVLFDLDGTLIDSIELILRSYEHTFSAHGLPALARPELVAGLGTPLWAQFRACGVADDEVPNLVTTYRSFNLEHHDELVRPYPGVLEAVEDLARRAIPLGVVTSKFAAAAWRGLRLVGLAKHFEVLVGADDVERHKPDPEPVRRGAELLGLTADACVYVGDSVHDMASARAAGARAVGVAWGPFEDASLVTAGAERVLAQPSDFGGLLVPSASAPSASSLSSPAGPST
ncbi:Pyrophosphatase PpaX [Planctomycetes bacterium Pla163]|uniref:Pyrophosphatase PpaX n=1 Tax=Rohdeia mirabilis TaxID=2528008 RepID=A0A518D1I9_9BACT|nr:Pyrophosphatase PpaX [Planctomycetes bacterium Pla163]